MTTTPYPFQMADVRRIQRDFGGRAIVASDVGLGKTYLSLLWATKHLPDDPPGPIVVIAPAHLKLNWKREAAKHLGIRVEVLYGQRVPADKPPPYDPNQVFVVNYDILCPPRWRPRMRPPTDSWLTYLKNLRPRLVIADEGHLLSNPNSMRTRAVRRLLADVPHVLILTGTPLSNKPPGLWPLLNMVRPDLFRNHFEFCCLLPGSHVVGDFVAGSKSPYSGEAVQLTCAGGAILRVTPNHPVLTDKGFVAAGQLCKGDYVVGHMNRVHGVVRGGTNNKTNAPTLVEDVFCSLKKSTGSRVMRLPTKPVDFHGDAVGFQGDIEVVLSDGRLRRGGESTFDEFPNDQSFVVRGVGQPGFFRNCPDVGFPFGDRLPPFCGGGGFNMAASFVGGHCGKSFGGSTRQGGSVTTSLFMGHSGPRQSFPFRFGSDGNPGLDKPSFDCRRGGIVFGREGLQGFSGSVTHNQIIDVHRFSYVGPVYDLETKQGIYSCSDSVSDGVIVSNCNYTNAYYAPWGRWEFRGGRNLDELHRVLTSTCMIRRRKCDVLTELPAVTYSVVPMEVDMREYRRAERNFLGWLETKSPEMARSAARAEQLSRMAHLKRLAAELKLPSVIRWVRNFLDDSDAKLLLGALHYRVTEPVIAEFGEPTSVLVDGRMSDTVKNRYFDRFNHDHRCRLMVGNIDAAGTGWSCTSTSDVAFVELPWRPGDVTQFAGRVHGISRGIAGTAAHVRFLVAADTIESDLCRLLDTKAGWSAAAIDGGDSVGALDIHARVLELMKQRGA